MPRQFIFSLLFQLSRPHCIFHFPGNAVALTSSTFESLYICSYILANYISKALLGIGGWGSNNLWNGGKFAIVFLIVSALQGVIMLMIVDKIIVVAKKVIGPGKNYS